MVRNDIPSEVGINEGVFDGNPLLLALSGTIGTNLAFILDTGATRTVLDKSLEPQLGVRKRRGNTKIMFGDETGDEGVFEAPKLRLGNATLVTGQEVSTLNMHGTPEYPIMGVLGMDCLQHYCFQLDFVRMKLHFLDPDAEIANGAGVLFPVNIQQDGLKPFIFVDILGQTNVPLILDTGFISGGDLMLSPKLFDRVCLSKQPIKIQELRSPTGLLIPVATFSAITMCGNTYSNVVIWQIPLQTGEPDHGFIGLKFLTRHLVTVNFPKRALFLKIPEVGIK